MTIITGNAHGNSAPPLYPLLTGLAIEFGSSEAVLRSVSWIAGVFSIPVVYLLSRLFIERIPAYFVCLLAAFSPTQVHYSQELREYSLTFLLAALAVASFIHFFRKPNWTTCFLMTLTFVAGAFVQYGVALLLVSLNGLFLLAFLVRREERSPLLRYWALVLSACALSAMLIYFISFSGQTRFGEERSPLPGYLSRAYWDGTTKSFVRLLTTNTYDILRFAYPSDLFVFLVIAGCAISVSPAKGLWSLPLTALPFVITFVCSLFGVYPYHGHRQILFLTPMLYVLAGIGFSHLTQLLHPRWLPMLLATVLLVPGAYESYRYLSEPGDENMRMISQRLSSSLQDGDRVYVYCNAAPAFKYYFQNVNPEQVIQGVSSPGKPDGYTHQIDTLIAEEKRIWLVFSHCRRGEREWIQQYCTQGRKWELIASAPDAWLYLVSPDS
jgi:mannosyltransferase